MNASKKTILSVAGTVALAAAAVGIAQNPGVNVNGNRHPNINAAQRACENAINSITRAQQANEYDMNGHAAKAKELLDQVDAELKAAAVTANHR